MRTTVRLRDELLERARREAVRRGTTLTALIEQGLRLTLRRPAATNWQRREPLPLSRAGGGIRPDTRDLCR